jgi:hypothetical protein
MQRISDDDLKTIRQLVDEKRAIPAVIVEAILERLAFAEGQRTPQPQR